MPDYTLSFNRSPRQEGQPAGWGFFTGGKVAHYFEQGKNEALCGGFAILRPHVAELATGDKPCARCAKKLRARQGE